MKNLPPNSYRRTVSKKNSFCANLNEHFRPVELTIMDRRLIRPSDMMADVMRDPSTILWSVLAITLWLVCGYAMVPAHVL